MSIAARLRRLWDRFRGVAPRPVTTSARSWGSARTNRLNSARWSLADDLSINQHLLSHLKTLRMRSTHEARNNPYVGAAIRSMRVGVVGRHGPRLQVMSRDRAFVTAAEKVFADWWRRPDINGRLSGVDLLNMWLTHLPTAGEFFGQFVTDSAADGVQTRVLVVDPRRCEHPFSGLQLRSDDDTYTILGVKRTATGRPVAYHFRDGVEDLGFSYRYSEVRAEDVIHGFIQLEAGQARGVPWLSECLDDIAELREFDAATLRAARTAAEHTVLLTATGPDVEFIETDDEVEIEPGTYTTMPQGYAASQLKPEHPGTTYKEFRHERLRSVGMAFQQPLMTILMDSSSHNYSSARFDGQTGARVDDQTRGMIEATALERMFWRVIREAQLLRLVPAKTPDDVRLAWHWPPRPHVDPKKEAEASAALIAAQLSTHTIECGKYGLDYEEDILDGLVREREARAKRGITEAEAEEAASSAIADAAAADEQPDMEAAA